MTVFSFLKGAFICASVLGMVLMCLAAWKMRSSFDFAKTAEVKQGVFQGYFTHQYRSTTADSSGNHQLVKEFLPMFSYKVAGRSYNITGSNGHFFRHLRNKVGEPVRVLVSPEDPKSARLGDQLSLYLNGALLGLSGLIFFGLPLYGAARIDRWRNKFSYGTPDSNEGGRAVNSLIEHVGNLAIPGGSIVIAFGSFIVIAGVLFSIIHYYTSLRHSAFLIEAVESGDYESAAMFAYQSQGIDAQNSAGESALIVALKAKQSDVAIAIINNLFVNTHVRDVNGVSAIQLAAVNGDFRTLNLLLKKGAFLSDVKPAAIYQLIRKGDAETIKSLIARGLDITQTYIRPSYGDQAILDGQSAMVRLFREHEGHFEAPPAFIALGAKDEDALRTSLKESKVSVLKFRGYTLQRLAEKTDNSELLQRLINE